VEKYFLLAFIFPFDQTGIVNLFLLQPILLTKFGVEGLLVFGTCKGTLFSRKNVFCHIPWVASWGLQCHGNFCETNIMSYNRHGLKLFIQLGFISISGIDFVYW